MRVRGFNFAAATVGMFAFLSAPSASAISVDAFGPLGQGGALSLQTLTFGSGGEVFQLDSFIGVDGQDLGCVSYPPCEP